MWRPDPKSIYYCRKIGSLIHGNILYIFCFMVKPRILLRTKLLEISGQEKNISPIEKILRINWNNYETDLYPLDRRMVIIKNKNVPCMNSENVRFLVNEIVGRFAKRGVYLEIGTYKGGSLLSAALFNSTTRCIGIDDFSQFDSNSEILEKNLRKFNTLKNIEFYNMDYKKAINQIFSKEPQLKVNVYYYDGAHSYENQLEGLEAALPYLADKCIIMIDDIGWEQVERANEEFIRRNRSFKSVIKIKTKIFSREEGWWNGFQVLARGMQ